MLLVQRDREVVKEAQTSAERRRLTAEAAVLRTLLHPGVVSMVGSEESGGLVDRIVLRRVGGTTLAALGHQPPAAVAGWGAAVATVVADMHDLGFTHGSIGAEHVLIDQGGRPILCEFGLARRPSDGAQAQSGRADDIRAVARMLVGLLPDEERVLRRRLSPWADGRKRRHLDARTLAVELVRLVPDAYVGPPLGSSAPAMGPANESGPQWEPEVGAGRETTGRGRPEAGAGAGRNSGAPAPAGPGRAASEPAVPGRDLDALATADDRDKLGALLGWHRPAVVPAVAMATAIGLLLAIPGLWWLTGRSSSPRPPPVDGYVLRTAPSESVLTVVGRWGCGADRPAVLDARSGSVWVFGSWPGPGRQVPARLLGRIPGATGLGVSAARKGCDHLMVLRGAAPVVDMAVGGVS